MYRKPVNEADVRNRCAIILAAGEGVRLRSFVQRLRGDALPKQYVKFFGSMSMLQATFKRAARSIPPERTFTVVDRSHFEFAEVTQQLVAQPKMHFVVQSRNRDTAIGLLLPLAHLLKRHPDATVAVFPSDHFISDDDLFMAHVDAGFGIVEQDAAKIILLGIPPRGAEPDYGYIVPGDDVGEAFPRGARVVSRFVEKPSHAQAQEIVSRGGFWNTLIMIFKARNFLAMCATSMVSSAAAFGEFMTRSARVKRSAQSRVFMSRRSRPIFQELSAKSCRNAVQRSFSCCRCEAFIGVTAVRRSASVNSRAI
jgi:mannose-1-phosphate guanylyltransferase